MKNKEFDQWFELLENFKLPTWSELPDFDLYGDQVITLVSTYLNPLIQQKDEAVLTNAMINNYVKLHIIEKASKKKYTKEHVAYLIAITALKQVLTISEVKEGILYQANISGLKEAYNLFVTEIQFALHSMQAYIRNGTFPLEESAPSNQAIRMACVSLISKLVAEKLVRRNN